ncbi:hypothetical protein VHEMI03613 [[Torrubiella] hemipterigena]|uniref:Uncharacterized protein n=1 Tax=[Torrubiella] hemipterigena TaxID=1531966 RepID=A0A0A1SZ10_9HYPO|nr:hypothetical protein VHEMI03613 [[Torrubiella] hemipterigena]
MTSNQGSTSEPPVLPPVQVLYDSQGEGGPGSRTQSNAAGLASQLGLSQTNYQTYGSSHAHKIEPHRFLTPAEWIIIAKGIGGVADVEQAKPLHPTC